MKKNYNCPAVEVMNINAAYNICAESVFGSFTNGGGTDTIDPETGGL
ncbi:MAG: hypothetical protein IKO26_07470 [Paludibacteraceae bacterium]|nr:hypothetical protein [Paludibacteraceae bacterium]